MDLDPNVLLQCWLPPLIRCLPVQFPMPELPQQQGHLGEARQPLVTIGIGMLRAQKHMGVAHVACEEGCTCEESFINLHSDEEVDYRFEEPCQQCLFAAHCMHACMLGPHNKIATDL